MGGEFVGFETFTKGDGPILGGNLGGSLLSILGVFLVRILIPRYRVNWYYGESENPERVPKAIKQVFWRILLFYILAIFVIGMLIPYDSNALMGGDDNIATSPFTLVFKNLWVSFCGIIYECSYFNISFIEVIQVCMHQHECYIL